MEGKEMPAARDADFLSTHNQRDSCVYVVSWPTLTLKDIVSFKVSEARKW